MTIRCAAHELSYINATGAKLVCMHVCMYVCMYVPKHTYMLSNQLLSLRVRFETPLPVRVFAFQRQHNSRCSEPKPLSL